MTALTVGDIKTRVKQQFGDESGAQITDAMILTWINDAQKEIVSRTDELFQVKAMANTTAGTADYSLPTLAANIIRFRRVYYKGVEVQPISIEQAEQIYPEKDVLPRSQGAPRHCWIWADRLIFEPAPDSTGAHLTIYYQQYPANLVNDGDAISLPERYHLKVKDYCIAQAAELDDDDDRAQAKMAVLVSELDMMRSDTYRQSQQDTYPFVTISTEDQFYGY